MTARVGWIQGHKESPLVLLSGKWLLEQQPSSLPERSKLPQDAILPLGRLTRVYNELKKRLPKQSTKLLPLICVLSPETNLDSPPVGVGESEDEGWGRLEWD